MYPGSEPPLLRQAILSVCITEEIDVLPHDQGVLVPGPDDPSPGGAPAATRPTPDRYLVRWSEMEQLCSPHAAASPGGRRRLATLLRLHGAVAALGSAAGSALRDAVQVIALPAGHVDHLGPRWAVGAVPGGALWIGPGVVWPGGWAAEPPQGWAADRPSTALVMPLPLPPSVLAAAGVKLADCWPAAAARAARMSETAAELLNRDGAQAGLLTSVGGCDVLTLLAYPALRRALAAGDGVGMRTVGVPRRSRGWWDLTTIDPDYLPLAWRATDDAERGVPGPLLVTEDEVVAVPLRGRPDRDLSRPWVAPA